MAPRRGGGGIFSGGSSASCSSSAFTSELPRIDLGYLATYLLIDLVLLWVAARKLFRFKHSNKPPGRWLLMLSIIPRVCAHAWSLLFLVLDQCLITTPELTVKLALVSTFLHVIAISLLVGALMVSICKRLHQIANMSPRLIAILHGLWTGGFAGSYLIAMCIYAAEAVQQFEYSSSFSSSPALESLARARNGLMILAGVLFVAGMLSTAYTLLSAMSRGSNLKTSSLRRYAPFLAATCVGFAATFLAEQIVTYRLLRGTYVTPDSYYAVRFLYMFFYSASFLLAVLIVTSPALANNEPPGVVQETFQQQPAASYAYPVQPNPPGPNVPLMQQYPQQSYPPVPPVQPYQANQQPYDPHSPRPPAAYY
ncbi:hypothetical protein BDBG_05777 [Blastomyces gilchristii SLH14081]|uniref:Integral membrane protein n=1 Tax=Blastomyces gilchristii (strain SLH14081) TaxID=559298 RepID=A0A179UPT0_BLAGS|nr:uncharacterized protein BDBG_05777 [Blastomyces gilchristii SLH14081]OAT10096.1 hypothetical protein BDBG_05777 [Blastomyces gilchristii SLH14081]